jgi:two-component system, NarL family, response regulator NreC
VAISVLLADDHPVVRMGVQTLLEREPDFSIAGVAADGRETVRLAEQLKPDVLVLDLMMPELDGLEVLRILRESLPATRIVILTLHSSTAFISQALQRGATGYVLKNCAEQDVVRAVREASVGRRFLSPPVVEIAIDDYIEQSKTSPFDPHETSRERRDEKLSNRERQVLRLIGLGNAGKEIAAVLGVSEKTVSTYRSRILVKLELKSTAELIRYAVINRLTD